MQYIWKQSNFKILTGKWKIGILLEAGYKISDSLEIVERYDKIGEYMYFKQMLLPYPHSQPLTAREISCFCCGLNKVEKYIPLKITNTAFLTIALRWIQFSDCNIQEEAFTAAAIQWASEVFDFPVPVIKVYFDDQSSEDGMNGKYIFDFSSIGDYPR